MCNGSTAEFNATITSHWHDLAAIEALRLTGLSMLWHPGFGVNVAALEELSRREGSTARAQHWTSNWERNASACASLWHRLDNSSANASAVDQILLDHAAEVGINCSLYWNPNATRPWLNATAVSSIVAADESV